MNNLPSLEIMVAIYVALIFTAYTIYRAHAKDVKKNCVAVKVKVNVKRDQVRSRTMKKGER